MQNISLLSDRMDAAAKYLESSQDAGFPNLHMTNEEMALKLYLMEQEISQLRREIAEWKENQK